MHVAATGRFYARAQLEPRVPLLAVQALDAHPETVAPPMHACPTRPSRRVRATLGYSRPGGAVRRGTDCRRRGAPVSQSRHAADVGKLPAVLAPAVFDIAETAGRYATLAAVLAGFAFTTLMGLLTARIAKQDLGAFAATAKVLIIAFLGLILASVAYSVMSAHTAGRRLDNDELLVGFEFAVCAILLFYAVALAFDAADRTAGVNGALTDTSRFLRAFSGLFVAPLLNAYVFLGVTDYETAKYGAKRGLGALDVVGVALVVLHLIVACVVFRRAGQRRRDGGREPLRPLGHTLLPNAAVGVLVVTAALFALEEEPARDPSLAPPVVMAALLVANALMMLLASCSFAHTASASGDLA